MEKSYKYCGRVFSLREMEVIRQIIGEDPSRTRWAISKRVCEALDWLKPDGGLKEMSCRVALLRMQKDELITLPPPRRKNGNGRPYRRQTSATDPDFPLSVPAGHLTDLRLEVATGKTSHLWNEYIQRYHYLGYQPLPGAQLRYFALAQGRILALLGFGAAAWKTAPRDQFIGWTHEQREKNLHRVINNARFLILPWVTSKNFASKLLAMAIKRLPIDWENRYGYRPLLLETFVEKDRFRGTCYKAANWICLGETQGRGKLDTKNLYNLPVKTIWAFPLDRTFRQKLRQ